MRLWALVGLAALGASTFAAGYDDFSRGLQELNMGRADAARASFTKALESGDLASSYVPDAYLGRARARSQTGDCAGALSDANEAIKRSPNMLFAHQLRIRMDECLGDYVAEKADIDAALAARRDPWTMVARAMLKWRQLDYAGTSDDFVAAAKFEPPDATFYAWSAAAQMHAGTYHAAEFAELVSGSHEAWAKTIFDLYLGKNTPDAVMRAVANDDAAAQPLHKCQADFFIGEWQLWRKEPDAARASLRQAVMDCKATYFLERASQLELSRLQ